MHKVTISTNGKSSIQIGNTLIIFGTFNTVGNKANQVEKVDVTFPTISKYDSHVFSSSPNVFSNARSAAPYTKAKNITVSNKGRDGFSAYVIRTDSSSQSNNYLAIGERQR